MCFCAYAGWNSAPVVRFLKPKAGKRVTFIKTNMQVKTLTFNPFQENTYLLYDNSGECAIVDPGMLDAGEEQQLTAALETLQLKPVKLIQTHLHLDHVFGTRYVAETYGLEVAAHADDFFMVEQHKEYALNFGIQVSANPPMPKVVLNEGDVLRFGETELQILHVPGHSPGSVVFYHPETRQLIGGDVLFQGSVGRTDLPGGNHEQLITGIQQKLMVLPDEVRVYPGHGPLTTIGAERAGNPYL